MNMSTTEFPVSPSRRGTLTHPIETSDTSISPPKPKLLQPSGNDPEVLSPEELQDLVQVYLRETGQTLSTLDGLRTALQKSNIFVSGPTLNGLFMKHVSKSQATDRSSDATYSMSCAGFVAICNAIKLLSIQERQVVKGPPSPILSNRRTSLMPSARRVVFDGRTSTTGGAGGGMMGSTSQHFSTSRREASSPPHQQRPQVVERLLSSTELADRYAEEDLVEALRDMQPPSIPHNLYGEITSRAKVLDGMKSNDRTGKLTIPNFSMRTALRSGTPAHSGKEADSPWDRASMGVLRQYAAMRKLGNPSPSASKRHSLTASASFQSSPSALLGVTSDLAESIISDGVSEEVLQILAGLTTEEMTTLAGVERAIIREKVSMGTNENTSSGGDAMDPFALYPYLEFANDLDGLDDSASSPRMTPLRMYAVDAILQQVRNGTLAENVNQLGLLTSPLMYATLTPDDIHGLLATDTPTDNTIYESATKPKRGDDVPITTTVTYAQLAEQEHQQQQFDADLTSKTKTVLATLTACGVRPEDELECLKAFRTASALMHQKRMMTNRSRARSFRKPSLESISALLVEPETASHPLLSAAAVVDPIYSSDQLSRLSEREIKVLEKLAAVEAHLFLSPVKAATIETVAERSEMDLEKRASMTFGKSLRNRKKSFMGALPSRDFDLPMDPSHIPADSFDEMENSSRSVEHLRRSYPLLVSLRDAVGVFVEQQRLIEERVGMVTERSKVTNNRKRDARKSPSSADGWMSPSSSAALGSRHFEMSDSAFEVTLDQESPRSKLYRNVDENQKRWDHLRHLEALKSQADEDRKVREREQESRLVTAFSPCDMPYEEYFFVPQLKHRPKKVPLFLKKSFSPVEANSVLPAHSSSTSTSFAGQHSLNAPSLGGETSVASLRSPHRYQTTLDRRGDRYYTESTPVSHRARSSSVYHQGVKLQHAFLKPITKTTSPSKTNAVDGTSTTQEGNMQGTPKAVGVGKVPHALSPSMVSTPASHDEVEMRLRTHGHEGKRSLYPEGAVGCSLIRSSLRSQSTEPSTGNNPTEPATRPATSMEARRSKEGPFAHARPGSKRPATPVPAGVQAILSKFLGDAASIQKSRPGTESGSTPEKRPPVYRLQGKRKPIGFKA